MISEADAIVNPWTVMIHLQYAKVTYSTMMTAVGLVLQTPLAETSFTSMLFLDELHIASPSCILFDVCTLIPSLAFWHCSRARQNTFRQAVDKESRYDVEAYKMPPSPCNDLSLPKLHGKIQLEESHAMQKNIFKI
jgi:hypothetical protein